MIFATTSYYQLHTKFFSAFDDGHEVNVFPDISKAFYKVLHEGLLFKSQQNEIWGDMITLVKDFLSCRRGGCTLDFKKNWHLLGLGIS